MKKIITIALAITLLFQCFGSSAEEVSGKELLEFVESAVYAELADTLDQEIYVIEEVSTIFISKEYLEEIEYNSQANIFFGFRLSDIYGSFQDTKYVFTLGNDGKTSVEEFKELQDEAFNKVIKNILIGTGIILVCVTVSIITKNPASLKTASKTVKLIYSLSTKTAHNAIVRAKEGIIFGGMTHAVLEATQGGDTDDIKEAFLIGASEGFTMGALFGTVEGIVSGLYTIGNTTYFRAGSAQAKKYPNGVKFTTDSMGSKYPRFEDYSIATAKFDMPTLEKALNHTGLSGTYYWDAKLANAQCGFDATPAGYVWHHVEDMQTLILVPQDLHSARFGGIAHNMGGASLIKKYLGL